MSERTNDEKLKILKERLAQIRQKQESYTHLKKKEKIHTSNDEVISYSNNKKPEYSSWITKIIFISLIAYGIFYGYNNIISLDKDKDKEEIQQKDLVLKYNINLGGNNIAIVTSFKDESSAKALVNNLRVKGFKTDYLFLPNQSNSIEEIYQVFIGPYENEEETNQWVQNIDKEVTIINVTNGTVIRKMKSDLLIQKEKAEKEAENKRIAKEKAENERIAKEKAENERIAKEKAENERIAKEKTENERKRLEEERIKKEKIRIEEERKLLLLKSPKILISYTYQFIPTVENEGILIIDNNAGYPRIKQNFSNVQSQGGIDNIIKNIEYDMNSFGALINGIYFEKSGTIVPVYKGKTLEVYW